MKTAFVFPGQGAQYIGMAMDYVSLRPEYLEVLHSFEREHGTDLKSIMTTGPEEALKETRFTQPAILFHSICALKYFQEKCSLVPDFVAGHSLGEFTALVASGVLSWKDAMHIVHKRGEYMIKAVGDAPFAMAAIIGLDSESVKAVCLEAETSGLVLAVNFNTPIQTVISGSQAGVQAAMELAKAKGAKRALPLVVGGPFHTPMIDSASAWLGEEMQKLQFNQGSIPVVSNLDALPSTDPAQIRGKLEKQIISPVLWVDAIHYMKAQGVTRFVEFGPQKVLSGMIKNIDKDLECINLDKAEELDAVLEFISK